MVFFAAGPGGDRAGFYFLLSVISFFVFWNHQGIVSPLLIGYFQVLFSIHFKG
jgi:hypothetical protein